MVNRSRVGPGRQLAALACAALFAFVAVACSGSGDGADGDAGGTGSGDTGGGDTDAGEGAGDETLGDLTGVRGSVDSGSVLGSVPDAVPLPVSLTVPSRGGGNGAVITGVTVGGDAVEISWDGGRSLVLDSPGEDGTGIVLGSEVFELTGTAVRAHIGGLTSGLQPGQYTLVGPVAVGRPGDLAEPRDQVTFVATSAATVTGTGSAFVEITPGDAGLEILGPGSVSIGGLLTVTTATDADDTVAVDVGAGSYELLVTVDGGALRVDGRFAGPVAASDAEPPEAQLDDG